MYPKIMIIASGETIDPGQTESAFSSIEGLTVKQMPVSRSISGALKVAKWIGEFIGGSGKVADMLIEQASRQLAGASVEIQFGTTIVKVTNVNRSQIVDLLDKAAEIASGKAG